MAERNLHEVSTKVVIRTQQGSDPRAAVTSTLPHESVEEKKGKMLPRSNLNHFPMPILGKQPQRDLHEGKRGLVKQQKVVSRIPGKHLSKSWKVDIKFLPSKSFFQQRILEGCEKTFAKFLVST